MADSDFIRECERLGVACAKARMRCDERAPSAFRDAYRRYRGPRDTPGYFHRKWLSLRLSAVRRGMVLDAAVSPAFLESITPARCPVTLEPLDIQGRSSQNPSVDRLLNDGTYAPANLVVLSLRANRAKGEKTFEDIEKLVMSGEDQGGLTAREWLRLLALMHGAWSVAPPRNGMDETCIVPMATFPPRHIFTSTCQVVQLLLLQQLTGPHYPEFLRYWLLVTAAGGGFVGDLLALSDMIRIAAQQEPAFLPDIWQSPEIFGAYFEWYVQCRSAIREALEGLRASNMDSVDTEGIRSGWRLDGRYHRQPPFVQGDI